MRKKHRAQPRTPQVRAAERAKAKRNPLRFKKPARAPRPVKPPKPKRPVFKKRAHPIRDAALLSKSPTPTSEAGYCLRETREVLQVGPSASDAIGAWNAAQHKHPTTEGDRTIPAGVPIFWSGGSAGHGHVAIAAVERGYCWSMDLKRRGYWDKVRIVEISRQWGLTFLGWTEDLNRVRVYPNRVPITEGVKK